MANSRMATFIDNQGGTNWKRGSHTHFRLTAAWLPTANVGSFQEEVRNLRKVLGHRIDYDFEFSNTHHRPEWRSSFYNLALKFGLRFTTCAFDKRRIRTVPSRRLCSIMSVPPGWPHTFARLTRRQRRGVVSSKGESFCYVSLSS